MCLGCGSDLDLNLHLQDLDLRTDLPRSQKKGEQMCEKGLTNANICAIIEGSTEPANGRSESRTRTQESKGALHAPSTLTTSYSKTRKARAMRARTESWDKDPTNTRVEPGRRSRLNRGKSGSKTPQQSAYPPSSRNPSRHQRARSRARRSCRYRRPAG